jgi:hypothetical protein
MPFGTNGKGFTEDEIKAAIKQYYLTLLFCD